MREHIKVKLKTHLIRERGLIESENIGWRRTEK